MATKQMCVQLMSLIFLQFSLRALSATCSVSNKPSNSDVDLGIEDGSIPDQNIRATSYSDSNHRPWRARIRQEASGQKGSAWCARTASTAEYLEVDLVFPSKISYIAAEGKNESTANKTSFDVSGVSTFYISYSVDNKTFEDYIYNGGKYSFDKGADNNNVFYCSMPYPIVAQYVRFHPTSWESHICLKVGLYGESDVSTEKVNVTQTTIGSPDFWWWILFWVILGILLITAFVFCIVYTCCLKKREHFSRKSTCKRTHEAISSKKRSHRDIPLVERGCHDEEVHRWEIHSTEIIANQNKEANPEEEVQEVTADFTLDEVSNKRGVVGFSVEEEEDNDHHTQTRAPDNRYEELTPPVEGYTDNELPNDYEEVQYK